MGKSNVEIFLRPRPTAGTSQHSAIDPHDNRIEFNLTKDESGYINNQRVHYEFGFTGVFDKTADQVNSPPLSSPLPQAQGCA